MANSKNKISGPESIKTILAKVILVEYDKSTEYEEKKRNGDKNEQIKSRN